ncbi:alpha/beta fold hydrolase [Nonomuraea gerenzanensis]|uniref:Salicylate esterase n=1 Tax=Nonomuraea gerenzanensis TaxID=93944 RepID=A0A1M4EC26_9ACTN|nr:alpha/beta hydrolase family protein [Nonomuraea gerenzanensis]UBU18655.1 alpha/beta hydrolase [Nonomuraea gerenzanensis]SBO96511.1 salicylate esterase [Nonomuraea gerenzanensis]
MTTFVLIPGMCHGGWCFHELTEQLRSHGHRAYPLTLTGLSERSHLLHGGVNLDTHIRDVTGVLAAERLQDVVLVGHSYGGMVITGVADRMPGRVSSLVYLDAVVPADGQSMWDLVSDTERQWYLQVTEAGDAVRPLPFFDPRATPHPLACLLQPLRVTGGSAHNRRDVYVYAAGWPASSPFTATYQRLCQDPAWITYALDSGHNLMRDAPQDLLKILLETGEAG